MVMTQRHVHPVVLDKQGGTAAFCCTEDAATFNQDIPVEAEISAICEFIRII
jgi:hypothetical protein